MPAIGGKTFSIASLNPMIYMTEHETPIGQNPAAPRVQMKEPRDSKEIEQKYRLLLARYKAMQQENDQLREEIESFNSKLIEREHELDHVKEQMEEMLSLLQQMHQEDMRLPVFQARSSVQNRERQENEHVAKRLKLDDISETAPQELLALNIWLATHNRFMDKILGHYLRQRDHVLCIPNYNNVKEMLKMGMLPDIIITGAYDFGLDDPRHLAFFQFLDETLGHSKKQIPPHEFYVLTLSSSVAEDASIVTQHDRHTVRHEFISKFRGLQVTISEVRYFLEMRRCRKDMMQAELMTNIRTMGDVARIIMEIQEQQKTGLLDVLSDDNATQTRWTFQLFFLQGKLLKTEHSLESSVVFPGINDDKPLEKIFTLTSLESTHKLNPPRHLFFFALTRNAVLREIRNQPAGNPA
ncbi:hypothetical protein U14_05810 [Candidatus Moduliflexus flocculans]|uniref:Uncharacterized protein n=1 Tax=Candidatus Moduliflexus flocculans TaxID=1499966 RepID=A0A081BSZ2_9BACT|nr:hypothetical protein U14_05810 [Candidatus Moduliflexus flocculans]